MLGLLPECSRMDVPIVCCLIVGNAVVAGYCAVQGQGRENARDGWKVGVVLILSSAVAQQCTKCI